MRKVRLGFTLIELLVVIAIIAILAAILFPVFSQARAKAFQGTCTSNNRNISMAFAQYSNDYDERYPPLEMWAGWTNCLGVRYAGGDTFEFAPGTISETCDPFQRWAYRIQPYMRNANVFTDPAGGTAVIEAPTGCQGGCRTAYASVVIPLAGGWGWIWHPIFGGIRFSYGYNQLIAAHTGNAGNLAKLQRPANILLVADAAHKDAVPEQVVFRGQSWSYTPEFVAARIIWSDVCGAACNPGNRRPDNTRHFQGSVISYADGHTKFMQHSQIWAKAHELVGLDQLTQFTLRGQ